MKPIHDYPADVVADLLRMRIIVNVLTTSREDTWSAIVFTDNNSSSSSTTYTKYIGPLACPQATAIYWTVPVLLVLMVHGWIGACRLFSGNVGVVEWLKSATDLAKFIQETIYERDLT